MLTQLISLKICALFYLNMEIFTDQERKNILRYQYEGGDEGIITKNIYDPLSNAILNHTPTWLA